jgi:hypothetical protein
MTEDGIDLFIPTTSTTLLQIASLTLSIAFTISSRPGQLCIVFDDDLCSEINRMLTE